VSVKVRVTKDRTKAYRARLDALAGKSVRVGILGSKASASHGDGSPLTVAEVAVIHEFGATFTNRAGNVQEIPMRSFIRTPVEAMRPQIRQQLVRAGRRSIEGAMEPEQVMEFIGSWIANLLADGVRKGLPVEPLRDSTKAKRRGGVYVPLFDTGQLASSISYEVKPR